MYVSVCEMMEFLYSQDDAAMKQPSLETLLASPERDYVISDNGDKVPIRHLEDKVVALYLYEDGFIDELEEKLKIAYEQLAVLGKNFEVVLINSPFTWNTCTCVNGDSFWERFETMPWLALPFKDPNCRKLAARIFSYPLQLGEDGADPKLVIIGPHGKFVEAYGASILLNSGIAAYPFSRDEVVKLDSSRVKDVKLDMLLEPDLCL